MKQGPDPEQTYSKIDVKPQVQNQASPVIISSKM